jgi:phosphoribosylamine--glycine ligase
VCSSGYPDNYTKNSVIDNINKIKLDKEDFLFHAGTKKIDNKIVSNGGRVLNIVSLSDDFKKSREKIIYKIKELDWPDGFFRKDIGYKVIDK